MKSVLVVSNHYRTPLFFFSLNLLEHQLQSHWVCVSKEWSDWLNAKGVSSERITFLGHNWSKSKHTEELFAALDKLSLIAECESCESINKIISSDRILSKKTYQYAVMYLSSVAEDIQQLFEKHDFSHVILEATWAHELLIANIAAKKGITVLCPASSRILNNRFLFFKGVHQNQIFSIKKDNFTSEDYKNAENWLENYRAKKPKPGYFYRNISYFKPGLNWFGKFLKILYRDLIWPIDETRLPAHNLAYLRGINYLREKFLLRKYAAKKNNFFPERPYIYFPLHVQPEASIDVLGKTFINQIEVIRAIAATTPATHAVVVKDHSNFLGHKSFSFYRDLKKIPGVTLVSPFLDSYTLMSNADCTITISGTASLEAALHGYAAVTLVPMFFSSIMLEEAWSPYTETVSKLIEKAKYKKPNRAKILEFLVQLNAESYLGSVTDSLSDPLTLEEDNLRMVAKAFASVLNLS